MSSDYNKNLDISVTCAVCGHVSRDLTIHLKEHNMTAVEYKLKYNSKVVCSDVERKRRETCKRIYGNENYKNKEAALLSNETFEGGHSFRDSTVREKARRTKDTLYGNPGYTNREQAKKTCMERYGVEYTCQIPEVIKRRMVTLKIKYGKIFNVDGPCNKKDPPESFKDDYNRGSSIEDLCTKYCISGPTLTRWIKDLNLARHIINMEDRITQNPKDIVDSYLKACTETNKILSFYEYGRLKGEKYCLKIKRLFNTGKPYHHLIDKLKFVALQPDLWSGFLEKLSIQPTL